ncbi:MerR family transcriptional regulator [Robertmurraya sp. DFI.2.37]|jgi:DNA-binding transcriptional MerR regulator|uniref:MerR family transcriptional regulator n=1 Tax=Robertmurraya sp. DFI.2.37 TaxID=3031819 RepID=UPI001248E180|nr:MerR family transcriptional regulator [Robertmurraya sp. DFI.2.37]MDF1507333.1 MerR family transcriptional regulator [Robertmurraya sp. DFI.2.37]
MYTIGKLSKNTGVTVRTLDYYDEIGLIKPSAKTSGGHRLYNDDDLMKLERVLALKYMGFSLDKIKVIMENSNPTWEQSIQQQLDLVKKEQERLKMLEHTLNGILYSIELEGEVSWPIVFSIIQLYQQDPEKALEQYKEYLNIEEMEKVMKMNATNMSKADIQEWVECIKDIKNHLDLDPTSDKARVLAERWLNQAEKMFDCDENLLGSMWEALQNMGEGIVFYPMDKDVVHFIERVFTINNQQRERNDDS